MEWPAVLGIYGAIVATLTAGWSIWSVYRDRGCLKLELRLKRFELNELGEHIEKPVDSLKGCELHLGVVNVGRRPIKPDSWHGISRQRTHGAVDITFGREMCRRPLAETEQCAQVSRDFVEAFVSGLRRMYVVDSAGRQWYIPRNQVRATAKRIEVLHSADGEVKQGRP